MKHTDHLVIKFKKASLENLQIARFGGLPLSSAVTFKVSRIPEIVILCQVTADSEWAT